VLNVESVVLDAWPGSPALDERVHALLGYRGGVLEVREFALTGDRGLHIARSHLDLRGSAAANSLGTRTSEACGGRVRGDGSTRDGDLALSLDIQGVELDDLWRLIDRARPRSSRARRPARRRQRTARRVVGQRDDSVRDLCIEGRALDSVACDLALRPTRSTSSASMCARGSTLSRVRR